MFKELSAGSIDRLCTAIYEAIEIAYDMHFSPIAKPRNAVRRRLGPARGPSGAHVSSHDW